MRLMRFCVTAAAQTCPSTCATQSTRSYRTGTPSDKVILVMATNGPEQLDEAVHDRIDEIVGFKVPTKKER